MIKDIAVNLGIGERLGHVGDYAVSMAATFDAHIAGIAFVYDPILPLSIAGYLPAEQAEKLQRDTVAATQAAVDRFAAASARASSTKSSAPTWASISPAMASTSRSSVSSLAM